MPTKELLLKNDVQKQYEDLIETEASELTLENIESIVNQESTHAQFERKYGVSLYSKILLVRDHGKCLFSQKGCAEF